MMASYGETPMPMAAMAVWLAFAGNGVGKTDIMMKSRLANECDVGPRGSWNITREKFKVDENIQQLAKKIEGKSTDDGISTRRGGITAKELCPLCTDVLLVFEQGLEGERADLSPLGGREESREIYEEVDDIGSGYGLVVSFFEEAFSGIRVSVDHCVHVGDPEAAQSWACQLQKAMRQFCNDVPPEKKMEQTETLHQKDLANIWQWNADVPETIHACVHDLIADTVRRQPDAPAICAWDGDLTYRELDVLSNKLAAYLVSVGVGHGAIVPLCFEKSIWTPVAMLGVMKAGAASVAMDTTHPEARLRNIVQQAFAYSSRRAILSSVTNQPLADCLPRPEKLETTVLVPEALVREAPNDHKFPPATVKPDDILYVVFTSGSTGNPKGAIITHANFSSAIVHQQVALGFDPTCRVLDFASYAFDVAWSDALHTLTAGGCMCIPSEDQRGNDIGAAIRDLRVNYLDLTPTVARQISSAEVPNIRTIVFGGERVTASDVADWIKCSTVRNPYGPAECTITSTVLAITPGESSEPGIGRGCGAVTWIVRPDGSGPAAVGETGELWLEGPIVGRGYLSDPEKTAAAFIEDPPWLLRGGSGVSGRRGRLYRTGDLVRYSSDGSLHFIGRKDDQVKIRGQRVELGDVEHHLRQCLAAHPDIAVVADVVRPSGNAAPLLAAFLAVGESANADMATRSAILAPLIGLIEDSLAENLPVHMIPTAYIPVSKIHLTGTGKTDRRRLRDLVAAMTFEQLANLNPARSRGPRHVPSTKAERQLHQLWASVLPIDANSISVDDNFSRIGGDSISAMRLVAAARDQGLHLDIADVFRHPRLSEMAGKLTTKSVANHEPTPFSLIRVDLDRIQSILRSYYSQDTIIVDVLPITDMQEGMIKYAASTPLGRTQQFFLDLPPAFEPEQLVDACNRLWRHVDMLRAIFVRIDQEYLQLIPQNVPLDLSVHTVECPAEAAQRWFASDKSVMEFGKCDFRMAIFRCPGTPTRLAMRLSHALYDGFTLTHIVTSLAALLNGHAPPPLMSFSAYMQTVKDQRQPSAPFWQNLLAGSTLTRLSFDEPSQSSIMDAHTVEIDAPHSEFSAANTFFAITALAISKLTGLSDITVGVVVSGRTLFPNQLEIAGPCVNFIPLRVKFDDGMKFHDIVQSIHDQRIAGLAFEASQMRDIAKASNSWAPTDLFGFILQFQNIDEKPAVQIGGTQAKIEIVEGPMVYFDPTIYVFAMPQGDQWAVTFISSPKFYQRNTPPRLADVLRQLSREHGKK
jgi:amino acid adenylation domain-containing protein